jgi:hypothetical protein
MNTLNDTLGSTPVAVGDLILTEVLQGFRDDKDYKNAKSLFNDLIIFDLVGRNIAIKSADNFGCYAKSASRFASQWT